MPGRQERRAGKRRRRDPQRRRQPPPHGLHQSRPGPGDARGPAGRAARSRGRGSDQNAEGGGKAELKSGVTHPTGSRGQQDDRGGGHGADPRDPPAQDGPQEIDQRHQGGPGHRAAGPGDGPVRQDDPAQKKSPGAGGQTQKAQDTRYHPRDQSDVETGKGDDMVDAGANQCFFEAGRQVVPLPHQEGRQEGDCGLLPPSPRPAESRHDGPPGSRQEADDCPPASGDHPHQKSALDAADEIDTAGAEIGDVVERSRIAEVPRSPDPGGHLHEVARSRSEPVRGAGQGGRHAGHDRPLQMEPLRCSSRDREPLQPHAEGDPLLGQRLDVQHAPLELGRCEMVLESVPAPGGEEIGKRVGGAMRQGHGDTGAQGRRDRQGAPRFPPLQDDQEAAGDQEGAPVAPGKVRHGDPGGERRGCQEGQAAGQGRVRDPGGRHHRLEAMPALRAGPRYYRFRR